MSIINDALKKTQMSFKKKDAGPAKEGQEKAPEKEPSNVYEKLYKKQADLRETARAAKGHQEKKEEAKQGALRSATKWLKALAVTVVILALIGVGLYFAAQQDAVKNALSSLKSKGLSTQNQFNRPAPKKRTYKHGELVLNGTSLIDGQRVALINDEIYQIGEVVDGKTITSIELNEIELQNDETIVTLRVH